MQFIKRSARIWIALFIIASVAVAYAQLSVVEEPIDSLPEDPLKVLYASPDTPTGTLLYQASVRLPNEKMRRRYFVLAKTGQKDAKGKTFLRIEVSDNSFDPEFSADGKNILFKTGWPYDYAGSFHHYIWNIDTRKVEAAPPEELIHRRVSLSPDGNFVAYHRGGNSEGNDLGGNLTSPLSLRIYDIKRQQSREIAQNPATKYVAWTRQGTLLYTLLSEESEPQTRPDLYEVTAADSKPKLILQDAYRPSPSPDGKWIACFTSTNPQTKDVPTSEFHLDLPRQHSLCLYNRFDKKRIVIAPVKNSFPDLLWTPDSRRLAVVSQSYKNATGEAQVNVLDVKTLSLKQIAACKAKDSESISWGVPTPQFRPFAISDDGKFLILSRSEAKEKKPQETFINELRIISAIDLSTGKIMPIASIYNWQSSSLGADWHS